MNTGWKLAMKYDFNLVNQIKGTDRAQAVSSVLSLRRLVWYRPIYQLAAFFLLQTIITLSAIRNPPLADHKKCSPPAKCNNNTVLGGYYRHYYSSANESAFVSCDAEQSFFKPKVCWLTRQLLFIVIQW